MPIETLYAARNIDFAPTINVNYPGAALPLGGATISMQVRLYPGAAGAALASDAAVAFEDNVHPDAELEDGPWRQLTLNPEITKEALATLPGLNTPDPGDPQTFAYEIKLTYADGMQDSLLTGEFIVSAGVDAT